MTEPDPPTLWHAVTPPERARPAPRGSFDCDLLVIGGGFTGLSTALHAAEAGLGVILLEAHRIAWGATGRNAGFVVPNFAKVDPDAILARFGPERGERLVAFAGGSADVVFGLIRQHGIACDAVQNGWIQPAPTAATLARTAARARAWAARGRPVAALDADEVARLTGMQGYLGGWIDRSGGTLNPVAYARGLARAAEGQGAQVFEAAAVTALHAVPGGWQAATESATVTARQVVLATNAHAGSLVPGLAESFFPLRVFQIATEPLVPEVRARLLPGGQGVSDSRRNLFSFRFDAARRLITGGMHIVGPGAASRVPRAIHRRMARLLDLPDLPQIAYAWSGQAAVMPDFLPRVFAIAPGLVAGTACNGRGIAMSTMLGRALADWAGGMPVAVLPVPVGPLAPIRAHALMRHAPNALLPLSMLRDRIER